MHIIGLVEASAGFGVIRFTSPNLEIIRVCEFQHNNRDYTPNLRITRIASSNPIIIRIHRQFWHNNDYISDFGMTDFSTNPTLTRTTSPDSDIIE